ncbi:hypothetical protein [Vibrio alginolyticus]|uniref:hypothetical protein n=1 Tax=Vibrio alginolyticus TaxID=663 RepID=UPI0038502CC7
MDLQVFATPYDEFWDNQNRKLMSQINFLREKSQVHDDIYYFRHHNSGEIRLDFSIFERPHLYNEHIAKIEISGQWYSLSSKEYAKIFFITAIPKNNNQSIRQIHKMLIHLIAFLQSQHLLILDSASIELFWLSVLGESVNELGFYNRLSPPSYGGFIKPFQMPKYRNALQALGIIGVIDKSLTKRKIDNALDSVCQSQIGVTLNEYKQGGSFNFLGLELGQYYVDYLRQVYEKNYFYMWVCKKTISVLNDRYGIGEFDSVINNRLYNVILSAITGCKFDDERKTTKGINHCQLLSEVQDLVYEYYKVHFDNAMSLNENCIEEVVLTLGLGMRFDSIEVIRVLMLQKYYGLSGHKDSNQVWKGYLSSLDNSFLDENGLKNLSVENIYRIMDEVIFIQFLKKDEFLVKLKEWGALLIERGNEATYRSFKKQLNIISCAMTNLFTAYTVYRASEYGFPLTAVNTEPNIDILDNAYVPFRFKLKWIVPKTNGKTKIDREITSQCFQIAVQLHELFDVQEGSPCLYDNNNDNSETFINSRVKANWQGFVENYQPFVDVLQLEELQHKQYLSLTFQEKKELERLSEVYKPHSSKFKRILGTAKDVRESLPRLRCTSFFGEKAQRELKESLLSYIESGDINNPLYKDVIETCLSPETKDSLRSGSIVLDLNTMIHISNEILRDVRYPTPHSFRHIWAEAVLTRYQGDIGTVIRHQFCHLDESFFMAYLRNKDTRSLMKGAKQRFLNSLVEMLLIDSDNLGKDYLGGFARYLKKAKDLTKTISDSEIRALRESVSGRIINIQPSYFAICVPRDGCDNRAKCAKFGSINPQDAKPEFCLNCPYALITAGNIRGIWVTIQPMVKEALNENIMGFMLETHLPTLRSGYRKIKELQVNSRNIEDIDKILNAINSAIEAIENKLNQEELMYGS